MSRPYFKIYTDGGADPNPGQGGWAYVIIDANGQEIEGSGGQPNATNNQMELTAMIKALQALPQPSIVTLFSDSQYLVRAIGGIINGRKQVAWIDGWRRRGWTRKDGDLQNVDLWKVIDQLRQIHSIEGHWIRGHSGNKYNERCDTLASAQINGDQAPAASVPTVSDHAHIAGGGVLIVKYDTNEQRDLIIKAIDAALKSHSREANYD